MRYYFVELWKKFYNDPLFFRRAIRGFLFWMATLGGQLIPFVKEASHWTGKDWAIRLIVSGVAGFAAMINLGELNPKESHGPAPSVGDGEHK